MTILSQPNSLPQTSLQPVYRICYVGMEQALCAVRVVAAVSIRIGGGPASLRSELDVGNTWCLDQESVGRTRNHGQSDVVDGSAEPIPDLLDVGEV